MNRPILDPPVQDTIRIGAIRYRRERGKDNKYNEERLVNHIVFKIFGKEIFSFERWQRIDKPKGSRNGSRNARHDKRSLN